MKNDNNRMKARSHLIQNGIRMRQVTAAAAEREEAVPKKLKVVDDGFEWVDPSIGSDVCKLSINWMARAWSELGGKCAANESNVTRVRLVACSRSYRMLLLVFCAVSLLIRGWRAPNSHWQSVRRLFVIRLISQAFLTKK